MRRLMRPALLLLLVAVVTLPAIADKAKDLFAKGQDAEARQQYEVAYGFFKQAYDLKPKDLRYRAAFERIRFEAAATMVHNGQKLREEGKLDEAAAAASTAHSFRSRGHDGSQRAKAARGGQTGRGGSRVSKGAGARSVVVHRQAGVEPYAENHQRPAESSTARRRAADRPGTQGPRRVRSG